MDIKDIVYGVIDDFFMDLSNDIIKVKNEEATMRDLSIKICKAIKQKEVKL